MANSLIWGSDLYKGFKLPQNQLLGGAIQDIQPFQMLALEDKTIDWMRAVADFYDMAGWRNVERKAAKIQRNYWMRAGKINPSDYIVNPDANEFSKAINWIVPHESQSPLEQFYPLAPNFVDVLRGEFIKRDNTWTIEAVDPYSQAEMFADKEQQFTEILTQHAELQKQQAMAQMGLTQDSDPQQYQQQMQAFQQQLQQVELASKNFRTTGVKWAEKVLKIHERRYDLHELEPDGFESGLITDSEYWHIDLLEDDFKLELLNPKYCDYFKGPNVKYVSQGDYFLWFDFMSTGDIVNKFGRKMKEEDLLKLKDVYAKTQNILVPDSMKNMQGAYYDLSKPWLQATDLNPVRNDALLGKELAYNYMRSPNFDHNIEVDIFDPVYGRMVTGHPQMFRVMRLYWRSMKRIGWLTKINRDGTTIPPDWVDENFKVTVEPEYDKSMVKEETKDNLIYGEHIDWTWVPEWRHIIKISANHSHSFWTTSGNNYQSVYIDGGPVKFQFKGRENPFDSLPPVEGCNFSYINADPHSFIDRIRPMQIIYNICMNKVPKKFLKDYGNKVAVDRRMMEVNNLATTSPTIDPVEAYDQKLMNSDIFDYKVTRESLEGLGQPALPHILPLSTVQEAQMYFTLGQAIKAEAGEIVGLNKQRINTPTPGITATGVQQGQLNSESQTEKYYEQHSNLMQRVRQRMLDAAQYYTTFQETARSTYMNEMDENVFIDIEGLQNLMPHYNITLQSKANVRAALQTIQNFLKEENTLPIKPSDKIQALIENSVPRLLRLIKEGELEQEIKEQQQQQAEQQQQQAQIDAENQRQAALLADQDKQKELDRENNKEIAIIRALGGMQSDNNADGQPDAKGNLDLAIKQQEITDKRAQVQSDGAMKRQTEIDKLNVERERTKAQVQAEKIKADAAIKVAKAKPKTK